MAKFIDIQVGSVVRSFSAENIITFQGASATTTTITYNSYQAGSDVLTLTHTSESTQVLVANAIKEALKQVHGQKGAPDVFRQVNLPSGITVSTAVLA